MSNGRDGLGAITEGLWERGLWEVAKQRCLGRGEELRR